MDIAILVLASCMILLLVAIFTMILLKNKGKEENIERLLQDNNDRQKEEIISSLAESSSKEIKTMLDELNRSNGTLRDTLTNNITTNNSTLTSTIATNNDLINKTLDSFKETQNNKAVSLEKNLVEQLGNIQTEVLQLLHKQKLENTQNNNDIKQIISDKFADIDKEIRQELDKIRTENQQKLDQMRGVVEEKMQDTLTKRLNESFEVISKQLLEVSKGLGEMSNLTAGVNNLNKVMSNVKTRGVWGEISLKNLLEQILTCDQYKEQVQIKGREMVDFAIVLPGKKDEEKLYLPIDAKFPLEDYQLLVEASENFDKDKVESARKALFKRIKEEAKSISTKYIDVPKTTNFAIMYLPIEGLYAEVVRDSVLLDELQNKLHIIISGPTTITALLNSLQLGFKTLHIQKSSKEVWNALGKFRTQFQKFSDTLSKVKTHADKVVSTIEDTNKKTKDIEKVLSKIGTIEFDQTEIQLIGGDIDEGNVDD